MAKPPRTFLLTLAVILMAQALLMFIKYGVEVKNGALFGPDFKGFWQAAQFAVQGNISALYDVHALQSQLDPAGMYNAAARFMPFAYPPAALLLLWPLAFFTYDQAVALWTIFPLLLYFWLVFLILKRSSLANEAPSARLKAYMVTASCLLPFICANIFTGQIGAFIGCFFLAMIYCWDRYPVMAGMAIALITLKPPFGLLVPFALLASARWRIIIAAVAATIILCAMATLWLGLPVWTAYLQMSRLFMQIVGTISGRFKDLAVGPYTSFHSAGLPVAASSLLQVIITLSAITVIIQIFRTRDSRQDLRFALLACGTLLVTPYGNSYDLPLIAAALIPFVIRLWQQNLKNILEPIALIAVTSMPYAQPALSQWHVPFCAVSLLLFFAVLYRRYRHEGHQLAGDAISASTLSSS